MCLPRTQGVAPAGRRPGLAATEFALILPVFLTLVLGCVDFGRFAYTYVAVTNAARTGAGFGGAHPFTPATFATWQAQVRQAVAGEMSQWSGYDDSQLSVTATAPPTPGDPPQAQVDVSYPFQTVVAWPGIPNGVAVRQVVVMPTTRP